MRAPGGGGKSGLHGTAYRLIYRAGRPDDQSNSDESIEIHRVKRAISMRSNLK